MAATETGGDALEQSLLSIWRQVLGRPLLGLNDDFFDLGGDSLASMQLMLAVEERFAIPLPLSALASLSTVAAMAAHLHDGLAEAGAQDDSSADAWAEVVRKQRAYLAAWTGHRDQPEGFIVTMNHGGGQPGLFWCFQGHLELVRMAAALGPGQPVHGMRSGHLIMDYTTETVTALARLYAREMMLIQPHGPFRLGGNCQGGAIMRAIAITLRSLGRSVSLLILMEQPEFAPYDEPVVLLFGSESHFNPHGKYADADAMFRQAYAGGFAVRIIPGAHGMFFTPELVPGLAAAVSLCLAAAQDPSKEAKTAAA